MFTGLVEEVGEVYSLNKRADGLILCVKANKVLEDTKLGDSIAINGVCLTVFKIDSDKLYFEVSLETLKRTNLKSVKQNDKVNLERALKASDRLGGHIVQGHVDTEGKIKSMLNLGKHTKLDIEIPKEYTLFVIEKGSIAVDGISLTINQIKKNIVSINIIPHTLQNTNLKYRKIGDNVNIEFDILGKYILKALTKMDLEKIKKEKKLQELLSSF
jgi:riboflavin synthase